MAINPNSSYPTRTTAPDSDYPYGSAQNVTSQGDGSGTPWVKTIKDDDWGFKQALLYQSDIVPSGVPDTALRSDYLDGVKDVIERVSERYVNTTVGAKTLSERIGGISTQKELGAPYNNSNIVDPSSWRFRNVCRGYDPVQRKETAIFIRDGVSTEIASISNIHTSFVWGTTTLSTTLPANHVPDSACCDGDAIYLLCHSAATGTAAAVHKFALNPWSATPVWSHTLSGGISAARDGSSIIKVADSQRIVVLFNGEELNTSVPALAVLTKSTGAETTGSGNHVAGTVEGGAGLCISSGAIWFTTRTSGREQFWINGAQITNPALAPTGYSSRTNTTKKLGFMESNGQFLMIPTTDGSISLFNTSGTGQALYSAHFENEVSGVGESDEYVPIIWDGQRFWTFYQDGVIDNSFLMPIDPNSMRPGISTVIPRDRYTYTSLPWSTVTASGVARMAYADGCIWLIPSVGAAINSIPAQRIPRLAIR
jgi:hypothetical protein